MPIESVMPSNHLALCHPLLPPSIFPSIRVFSSESVVHIRWPKYWNFSFSISPSSAYSGLISFRINWFDLLAILGSLKSLLQHHNSKTPTLRCSTFFRVQFSHPYMITRGGNGKPLQYSFREKPMNCMKRYFFHNIPEDNLLSTYYVSDTFLLGPGDRAVNKSHCPSKEQWGNQAKSPLPPPKNAQVHWLRV